MTLIVGVKLPKGVLFVSDTRETGETTGEIITEYKRKITIVTPSTFLATSGSESNFYAAKILRNCLYNTASNYTQQQINNYILGVYQNLNNVHKQTHIYKHPIGSILLADYDKSKNTFDLKGLNAELSSSFIEEELQSNSIIAIGSNKEIRINIIGWVDNLIKKYSGYLDRDVVYEAISKEVHQYFKSLDIQSIGKNVYVTYLSEINGNPASAIYYIYEDGTLVTVKNDDDGEIINGVLTL